MYTSRIIDSYFSVYQRNIEYFNFIYYGRLKQESPEYNDKSVEFLNACVFDRRNMLSREANEALRKNEIERKNTLATCIMMYPMYSGGIYDSFIHPITENDFKTRRRANEITDPSFYYGFQKEITVLENKFTLDPFGFFYDGDGIDVVDIKLRYGEHPIYINRRKRAFFNFLRTAFKFPLDHMSFSPYSVQAIKLSIEGYCLESIGHKLRKLMVIHDNGYDVLDFKRWEADLVFKYFNQSSRVRTEELLMYLP